MSQLSKNDVINCLSSGGKIMSSMISNAPSVPEDYFDTKTDNSSKNKKDSPKNKASSWH